MVGRRLATRFDGFVSRHTTERGKALLYHYLHQSYDNLLAVLPISLLLILGMAIFFQEPPQDPGTMILGLVCAIIGLLFFVDGLRILVMPLGELIGEELPKKYPLPVVLAVSGVLGVLVTFAEPAVASLQPLADLVDRERAPYLFYVLNQKQNIMVLCIGMGVGLAAIIGTLRFVYGWSLKPLIFCTVTPTLGLSAFMAWGMPQLAPVLGLAWDCGAVTTGPVTVPILLALGIGIMKCERQKKAAKAALQEEVQQHSGNALEGFGIVTLASVCPILAVLLLGLSCGLMYSEEEMLAEVRAYKPASGGLGSPAKEVLNAFRAILPLVVVLLLIVFVLLRRGLPALSVWVPYGDDEGGMDSEEEAANLADAIQETAEHCQRGGGSRAATGGGCLADDVPVLEPGRSMNYSFLAGSAKSFKVSKSFKIPYDDDDDIAVDEGKAPLFAGKGAGSDALSALDEADEEGASTLKGGGGGGGGERGALVGGKRLPWLRKYGTALIGYLFAQGGMVLFSLGLTYGFTALGSQAGTLLPAAFLEVEGIERSPYYPQFLGVALVLLLTFALGFLATRAEPALNVLGRTVEHLSGGSFSCSMLIYAVSFGVGLGMVTGACKVLFGWPLIVILLVCYAFAMTETIFASEDYVNIGWDSAGVTTGPVTVPFVLALGIGFATAVGAPEGFGILSCASVFPIMSVLGMSLVRRAMANASGGGGNLLRRLRGSGKYDEMEESMEVGEREDGGKNGAYDTVEMGRL